MDFQKNIFEDFFQMQNKMLEEQTKMYQNFMKNFPLNNAFANGEVWKNFQPLNNMDFFAEYKKFADAAERNFRELMGQVPNVNMVLDQYQENVKLLDRVYDAYVKLLTQGDYRLLQDAVKEVYETWNEQFIQLSRQQMEVFLPKQSQEFVANFNLDRFVQPFLAQQKKALSFYEEMIKKEPQVFVDRIANFYDDLLQKVTEVPVIGVNEELQAKNKENLKVYLDLQLKLLEFNLFLTRASKTYGIKAQKECLNKLETQAGMENFADFYEMWSKELKGAYDELKDSDEYQKLADEVVELVKKNRDKYDAYLEERLEDSPIFTAKKAQAIFGNFTKVRDDVEMGKMTQNELSKDVEVLRMNVEKDKRDLSQKFLDLQNKSEQGYMDLKQAVEQMKLNDTSETLQENVKSLEEDKAALQQEVDNLKKELEQVKAADNKEEVAALKEELAALKKEVEEVKSAKKPATKTTSKTTKKTTKQD